MRKEQYNQEAVIREADDSYQASAKERSTGYAIMGLSGPGMKTRKPGILLTGFFGSLAVFVSMIATAQHEHHQHTQDTTETASEIGAASHEDLMTHSYSLKLPMNRNGSGTGWLPDASPMYGYMLHSKRWMYMLHGNVFFRYNDQDIGNKGRRGDAKVDAPNWFMAMGQRRVGRTGLFHFNAMFSLDPLFGGDGYPLLFQTGETFNGEPLVDRQHPHNLFSELSVAYSQSLGNDLEVFVYLAYPGEPALGPVAFMHRPSSMNNPDSPLGHHWQDATHITFGVATAGFRYKIFKVDGSLFTGREPGEARYGFDKARFDSHAYRLTANPGRSWSVQVSRAFLRSPEAADPVEDVDRTTASITHAMPLAGMNRFLTSTLIWGHNDSGDDHREHSFTLESNLQLDGTAIYGRVERVQKSAGELLLDEFEEHTLFNISALTLGINHTIIRHFNTNFAIGAQGSIFHAAAALDPFYGKNPISGEIYLRVGPALMNAQ